MSSFRHFPLSQKPEAARPRLGLLVPATDHISEPAIQDMVAGTGIDVMVNRVRLRNPITVANITRMADDLTRASADLLPDGRLDAVIFSCTSGTVAVGPERIGQAIAAGLPGIPFNTPITAGVKGCKLLGLKRIAVLTPYLDEVNEPIRRFIEQNGVAVGAFGSFKVSTEPEIASIQPETILAAGKALDAPDIDGIFISCTGMRGHWALDALEQATGKPCLSSNQAQLWDALGLIGYDKPIKGFGSMLARTPVAARHAAE